MLLRAFSMIYPPSNSVCLPCAFVDLIALSIVCHVLALRRRMCVSDVKYPLEPRKQEETHPHPPTEPQTPHLLLDDIRWNGCENCQCYNEANCTNFKFLLLGMILAGNGAPWLFIVKEVPVPFFWLFPTIEYWFTIFIKLQKGACCLRPVINYENVFNSPVGTGLLMGRISQSSI